MKSLTGYFFLFAGMLVATIGLECFLLPNKFIDGGVTGISMLLAQLSNLPLGIFLVVVNAPFLYMAYRSVGGRFALRSVVAITGFAICVATIPLPEVTNDKLLAAVFGGIFVGAGTGLTIRGGGVLDGTEILALILSKKTFATLGEVILFLNVAIFSIAAIMLGVEPALYSVLTYLAATRTISYLLHGIEAYNSVLIVSKHHEKIRQAILNELGRGVTAFHAIGGYTEQAQCVLFCVVTRLELSRLENIVDTIDESAFVVVQPVHETSGGVVKRRDYQQ